MARVEPSFLFSEISGTVGANTVQRNNETLTLGNRSFPVGQRSIPQGDARRNFSVVRSEWANLTTDQKESWNNLAFLVSQKSIQAKQKQQRGYNLFVKYNTLPMLYGDAVQQDAPATYDTSTIVFLNWGVVPIEQLVVVIGVDTFTPPFYVSIWAKAGFAGARSGRLTPYRLLVRDKVMTLTFNVTPEWIAAFGPIIFGRYADIQVQIQSVGFFPAPKTHLGQVM